MNVLSVKKVLSIIRDNFNIEVLFNEDLTSYSRLRLKGARGDIVIIKSEDELKITLKILTDNNIKYKVIAAGSNQIYPQTLNIPYIKIAFKEEPKNNKSKNGYEYEFNANTSLSSLTQIAVTEGLKGWEVFTGIPATIGGAVFMNAGTELGEISEVVSEVKIINKFGEERILKKSNSKNELPFSYRRNLFCDEGDIITKVKLIHLGISDQIASIIKNYQQKRSRTQPLDKFTCGCAFKNYKDSTSRVVKIFSAGKFIDLCGLKGFSLNDISINNLHANFIENKGEGTYSDFCQFVNIIKEELFLQYGLEFELEIQI
ncbi:MAG: FAD-binding protein [Oligoflexia bacterium]|nr:FAD-binding protein [Oligoflexia bacterium]